MITLKNSRILLPIAGLLTITGAGLIAANAQAPTTPGAPAPMPRQGKGKHERHPEMMQALRSLEKAKSDLQKAAHDFDGHRAKALELTDEAIEQVKAGIKSDQH